MKKHRQPVHHHIRAAAATPPPDVYQPMPQQRKSTRLLDKAEMLRRIPYSYPTIWGWMRAGHFPRSRIVGQKTLWVESEIDAWIAALPVAPLKAADTEE